MQTVVIVVLFLAAVIASYSRGRVDAYKDIKNAIDDAIENGAD